MPSTTATRLANACREGTLIRFTRRFEDGSVNGYILDVGPQIFLLAVVDDYIRFNGFECFRYCDVRGLEAPHRHARFAEAALKKRGEKMPRKPTISVKSMEALLLSSSRAFPLVTIHREQVEPGVCWVGRVIAIEKGRVWLQEISADATWYEMPSQYKIGEITRVDFGGQYEEALYLVGGPPPKPKKGPSQ
jgi:hypothetical protein